MSNSKHGQLSLNDRINIARLLDLGNSLRKIAETVCGSAATISSEIKNRKISQEKMNFVTSHVNPAPRKKLGGNLNLTLSNMGYSVFHGYS